MSYEEEQAKREQALEDRKGKVGFDAQQGKTATRGSFETQGDMAEVTRGLKSSGGLNAHLLTEADAEAPDLAPEFKAQDHTGDVPEYMVIVESRPEEGGGGVATPLQLVKIDDTTIAVRYGSVEDVVPTISGTALDADHTQNTISISGATTLWLKATSTGDIDTDLIDAVSVETVDPGADSETQTSILLGSVAWASGKITSVASNLTGSQNVDSCGTIHSWNVV